MSTAKSLSININFDVINIIIVIIIIIITFITIDIISHLRYDRQISDTPSTFFYVDHATVCRRGGFIIQRHNQELLTQSIA